MNLSQQCVSKDIAKRMEELGVPQDSLFYWVSMNWKGLEYGETEECEPYLRYGHGGWTPKVCVSRSASIRTYYQWNHIYKKMKIIHKNIQIDATSGKETIANANDTFVYIDSDFKNWNTSVHGTKTKAIELAVCELTENSIFAQMFTKPDEMALSQEQIIDFCKNHKDKLVQDWCTFFLFKVGNKFFVAGVCVDPGGLFVNVHEFSRGRVWNAEVGDRFVLPQLSLDFLDSDSLEKAIAIVKKAGYKIIKEI